MQHSIRICASHEYKMVYGPHFDIFRMSTISRTITFPFSETILYIRLMFFGPTAEWAIRRLNIICAYMTLFAMKKSPTSLFFGYQEKSLKPVLIINGTFSHQKATFI